MLKPSRGAQLLGTSRSATDWAMESLESSTSNHIFELLDRMTLKTYACPCRKEISLRVVKQTMISMSPTKVKVSCAIQNDNGVHMKQSFSGQSLVECQCDVAVRSTNVEIEMTDFQWKHSMSRYPECLVVAAKMDGNRISLCNGNGAIIPYHEPSEDHHAGVLRLGELYCGGFSGWTHAAHELALAGLNLDHVFALDRDPVCCCIYQKTHGMNVLAVDPSSYDRALHESPQFGDCPSTVFQTTINDLWWMTCVGKYAVELMCLSPPCPAWSLADASPGLSRCDGFLLLQTLTYIAYLRPKMCACENVSNLKRHRHFQVVLQVLDWMNYRVHWSICLDLKEIIPQHRDRFLLLLADCNDVYLPRYRPVKWPVSQLQTLRTYQVVMKLDQFLAKYAAISHEEFLLYMDPKNLPKEFNKVHSKKLARDVMQYRLKGLDQTFSCIMTTYGRPTALSSLLIQRGGIYGSLFHDGPTVRKLVPAEICILMGLINAQFLPYDLRDAMSVLGNAIAVPHALIAMINCITCLREEWTLRGPQAIFADVMSKAIKSHDVVIEHGDDGYWVKKGTPEVSSIPATEPVRAFAKAEIKAPLHSFSIWIQEGLCITQVLRKLTQESFPLSLEVIVHGTDDIKFVLPHDMIMHNLDIRIAVNVPSCLILSETIASATDWPFIAVLHPNGILVVSRDEVSTGADMSAAVVQAQVGMDDGPILDFVGRAISNENSPPNVLFVGRTAKLLDLWEMIRNPIRFQPQAETYVAACQVRDVHAFIHWMEKTGIHSTIRALGWHFLVQLNIDPDDTPKEIILTAKAGRLAIQPIAVCQIIMTRIFINQIRLIEEQAVRDDPIQVSLKLWETWVWHATVEGHHSVSFIHNAWQVAHEMFGEHVPIVLMANGQRMNPDFTLASYARLEDDGRKTIRMHLVLQLRGGGPSEPSEPVRLSSVPRSEAIPDEQFYTLNDLVRMEETEPSKLFDFLLRKLLDDRSAESHIDVSYLGTAAIRSESGSMSITGTVPTIVRLMRDLHASGMEHIMMQLGWYTVMHIESSSEPALVKMFIIPP
eukprot:s189_g18.t1